LAMMPGPMVLPRVLRAFAYRLCVHCPRGHGKRVDGRPRVRVTGRGERQDVIEGTGRGVSLREGLAEAPRLSQGGDERGVAVFLVLHRARFDPRRHDDGRYPVAGAVEGEVALAGGLRWVRRGDWPRRDVVVGASRFVPADQKGGVPDVAPVSEPAER
jgi:hypothetical protein